MKVVLVARTVAFIGALAFAGAASAQSVTVIHGQDQGSPVVVEHPAPPVVVAPGQPVVVEHPAPVVVEHPPVVVEHGPRGDCSSRKVVNFHGDGGTTTRTTTNCD
jgi:hypothetical protein